MSLDEFQKAWNAEGSQPQMKFNAELLTQEVERSYELFRSTIYRRHLGQIKAVLGMIVMWLLIGIFSSLPWTWYLMIPALLGIAIVYLLTLKQYAKRPVVLGESVLVSVKASLAQVEHQIWLMQNLMWWNLLPVAIAMMAYNAHATWQMSLPWWGRVLLIGLWAFLLYHAFRWMSHMNNFSVQKELEPKRTDLQRIIRKSGKRKCWRRLRVAGYRHRFG